MAKNITDEMRKTLLLTTFAILAVCTCLAGDSLTPRGRQYVDSLHREGEKNYAQRQLSEAMNHYLAGLRISEKEGFHEESCRIYIGIGNLYSSQADYGMGIHFYLKALSLAKQHGHTALQNSALNNLVGASCFAGKHTDGKRYYQMLEANKENSTEYGYNLLMCQGLIASGEGRTAEAIGRYRSAMDYARSHWLAGGYTESARSCLAQLYDDMGNTDSALVFLGLNEASARQNGQSDLLIETLKHKASALAKRGDRMASLACKEEYVELFDSLYNRSEFDNMKNTQFLYEAQKSEKAIDALTEEKQHIERVVAMQRRWLLTLAAGAVILAALFAMMWRQKRQLRQAYNELFDRCQALMADESKSADDETARENSPLLTAEQREKMLDEIAVVMSQADIFCGSDFSIDKLASLIGSNSRYVSAAINDRYGKNFRTFLNEYRVREAMRRLSDSKKYGNYTIKAVAESVGFKSHANFIAVFTKITGMKPSIYQKISREREKTAV